MLNRLPPSTRIAMALTAAVIGILFFAELLGLLPNEEKAIMTGRANLCESLALSSSAQLMRNDMTGLQATLNGVCERNTAVLSIGLRTSDGKLLIALADHAANWQIREDGKSTDSQMQIPIFQKSSEKWGTLEFRFEPLRQTGYMQYLTAPMVMLIGFVSQACFVIFSFFLRLTLKHLDPSKVVPKRVRDALDNLAEGLLILDTRDQILLANHAFAQVVGVDAEKLIGHKAAKLGWQLGDSSTPHQFPWSEALKQQRPVSNARLKIQGRDGKLRTFSVNCSPLLGHQGRFCGVMATFDDVTVLEEKNVELGVAKQQAEDAQQAAEAANQAKSEFLANMSHEIRTPLNAVMGFTDVLRRGMEETPAKRVEYLNTIHSSGTHLLDLINDILDLSKIEAGKLELEVTACSPYAIMHDVINVLRVRAEQKEIRLDFELDGKIPLEIQSDATRLRQILLNLTGNAIKFTSTGGVGIVARLVTERHGNWMEFDVVDSGIGLTEQQLQKIFKPFEQADNTVTRRFGGTGLGLSISKKFANAMNGDITVTSKHGQGSVFSVKIPVGDLEGVELIDSAAGQELIAQQQQERPTATDQVCIKPSRILLVDDGESNRQLASLVLRRLGMEVSEATNGQEAVDQMAQTNFDLILMDMQMPVMDGYTAARLLRDRGLTMPIVALTANAMRGDEDKCRAAGCSHFLTKPIDINALIALLADNLGTIAGPPPNAMQTAPTNSATSDQPVGTHTLESLANGLPSSVTNPGSPTKVRRPVLSAFPLDDPEFRVIIDKFTENLMTHLQAMFEAFGSGDFEALADHAHWLKGAGGTVGFTEFTEPARRLETLAKEHAVQELEPVLAEIIEIAKAIKTNSSTETEERKAEQNV